MMCQGCDSKKSFQDAECLRHHAMTNWGHKNNKSCIDALPAAAKAQCLQEFKHYVEVQESKGRKEPPQQYLNVHIQVPVFQGETVDSLIDSVRHITLGEVCIKDKDNTKVPLDISIEDLKEHGVGKGNSVWLEASSTKAHSSSARSKPY
jgi:hypothetical protein